MSYINTVTEKLEMQAHWQMAPAYQSAPKVTSIVEEAVARGKESFREFHPEPDRGAWWGRLETGDGDLFVKMRRVRTARARLASLFMRRGLAKEWATSLWYERQGLPGAAPVALGEYRSGGLLQSSVLVTRWIEGSRCLADEAALVANRGPLIEAAGSLIGRLYRRGAIHRQFHPWNVLVVAGAEASMLPIDLQHLWVSTRLTDEDFLWALDQVSFWLHEPVIDWSDGAEARLFYAAVLNAAREVLEDPERINRQMEHFVRRGRATIKLHRRQWTPPPGF